MTLTGEALKEMKDTGRKAGLVPDVGSLFKRKTSTKQKNTPKTQQIFHEELKAEA